MKFVEKRPFADPDAAARKLLELANAFEPVQDGRIYIERINGPFLYQLKGTPSTARLVHVLPAWRAPDSIVHMVFTSRHGMAPATRAFVEHVAKQLRPKFST